MANRNLKQRGCVVKRERKVKEIRLDREFSSGVKAPSDRIKQGGPWRSLIKHGKEVNDTNILPKGWTNKIRGPNNQRRKLLQIIRYPSIPISSKSKKRRETIHQAYTITPPIMPKEDGGLVAHLKKNNVREETIPTSGSKDLLRKNHCAYLVSNLDLGRIFGLH